MTKFKKVTSLLLSLIMTVTAMAMLTVNASAADFDSAKSISLNKKISVPTTKSTNIYKFTIKEECDVWIEYTTYTSHVSFILKEESGRTKSSNSNSASVGSYYQEKGYMNHVYWDKAKEKAQGRFRYTLPEGTYYVDVYRYDDSGTGKISFTISAPIEDDPEIDYISLTLTEGTKIKLGAILTAKSTKSVTWTSSNKVVATVTSKGTLTAKSEGTTIITAKVGSSTVKIKVIVTE